MTTYATRSPLQLLTNPHMMSEPRRSSRRLSARQPDKEDPPVVNGLGHGAERAKGGHGNGLGGKGKVSTNGTGISSKGGRGKRKIGAFIPRAGRQTYNTSLGAQRPVDIGVLVILGL